MSGIKKLTPGEIKLITKLYEGGQTNIRLLTVEINKRRLKDKNERIKSINTVKNYLVDAGIYIKKRYVPTSQVNMTKILVDHNQKKELIELLNVTYPTIRKALRGKCASEISIKIREEALKLGGAEVEPTNKSTEGDIDGNCTPII